MTWLTYLRKFGLLVCLMVFNITACMAICTNDFTISHLGKTEGLDNQRIFSVCQSSSGAIWWSSLKGVGRFNGSKVRNYRLDNDILFKRLGGRVIHVKADSTGVYAFDNRGSVFSFNVNCDRFDLIDQISKRLGYEVALNDIYVDGHRFYLALHDGVYLMAKQEASNVSYANGKLSFDVPSMAEGEYMVSIEADGMRYGCGWFTVSNDAYVDPGVKETVLWEGGKDINWGESNVTISADDLAAVPVGATIRVFFEMIDAEYHAIRITTPWWGDNAEDQIVAQST